MNSNELNEVTSLAKSHPDILVISSDNELINQLREYIEDYDYNFIGSADTKEKIKDKIVRLSKSCFTRF